MIDNPIRVCFVDLGAYPLLTKKDMGFVGGSSVQQVLLANEITKHKFNVSFITYGDGKEHNEFIGHINIVKTYQIEDIPKMSILKKVWNIWRALAEVNADIYFHESGTSGVVSLYCYLTRKRFVRYISSDAEVNRDMLKYLGGIGRLGNWLDIKLADAVIAQSVNQQKMLKDNFGRDSYIIKNAFPFSDRQKSPKKNNPPVVLWVSTIRTIKQPELFLELAKEIPDANFQIIGGAEINNTTIYDSIRDKSDNISNLHFVGFVPFHEIDQYFEAASVFVNTSKYEGFPNAFIQAWIHSIPTITLNADPDGLIYENKMGFYSKTFEQMVEDVKLLSEDRQLREEMGTNGRRYVEANHNVANIVGQYIDVFKRIMHD